MQRVLLEVSGMKCGGCTAAVKRILLSQAGTVSAASVNLVTESAAVTFSREAAAGMSPETLAQQAAEALTQKVTAASFLSFAHSADADTGLTVAGLPLEATQQWGQPGQRGSCSSR